jgi:hypothetical protein
VIAALAAVAVLAFVRSSEDALAAALAQCADCHPRESASYARTGMARTLEPLREDELSGLAPVVEPGTGFTYAFEGRGASARVVEQFRPAAGPPWRDSLPIAFAIGAGELDRAFALRRGGRLWLAPLEVVGQGERRHAALAPGHAIGPGTRFTLPVTPECLACHTDASPPAAWPLNAVPEEHVPRGISCAACHPDLQAHVAVRARALAGASEHAEPDPLARPWSRIERMERCAACHLQGDARIELVPGRLGPPPPGTPLLDSRAVFVAREATNDIGFVSHVQRLVLSRCYLESAAFGEAALACESCHDPHRSVFEPRERALVRDACRTCHEPEAGAARAANCAVPRAERPAERDCAGCHMRQSGVFDVAEVRIHDHWIRRDPGAPSAPPAHDALRFPESARGDWRLFAWPDAPPPTDADDPGLWTLALFHGGHHERARTRAAEGLGQRARELPMLHHVRGSLLERAGELDAARAAYARALELEPGFPPAATNLAPLLARAGRAEEAKDMLNALIHRHPLAAGAWRNRAVVRRALGDETGPSSDLEQALRLEPDAALANALAGLAEERGDAAAATRWRAEARRLDPRLP